MEQLFTILAKYAYADSPAKEITLESPINTLGIDSLKFLLLLIDLEAGGLMGPLQPGMLSDIKTVGDLANLCKNAKEDKK
ncbi:phosphopantetheine-binding protein [Chitinophaga sp. HK235]|uniref:phosphopantetheine-binding protein n=1 Tax=Chitinophaga sp. HK235 TaxID=2952571 RepID=UPI001BA69F68|nr:phosphopantetheine-binding protein [Chitinophaga sp. HK235]